MRPIGIGIGGTGAGKVIQAAASVSGRIPVTCYCRKGTPGTEGKDSRAPCFSFHQQPELALVADLKAGRISAAVRGSLPANDTLRALKKAFNVDRLERIALLETAGGRKFLLAPVGVDEGWTIAGKAGLITRGRIIARRLGLPEKTGILSGGRRGDLGRHRKVDASMLAAEQVALRTGAEHSEILIEDAVKTCGIIIAPDGISGNLIFRTLTLLGAGHGHGAPVLNIPAIFVDTSRASPDYTNALMLAVTLLDR
jgi:putative methanogen marker protein 4